MDDLQKLKAVKEAYGRMKQARLLYEERKSRAESTTKPIGGNKVQGNEQNWQEEAIVKMIEAKDFYADCVSAYIDALREGIAVVDRIQDPLDFDIVYKRYIHFRTWKQITEETGYAITYCMKRHKSMLL